MTAEKTSMSAFKSPTAQAPPSRRQRRKTAACRCPGRTVFLFDGSTCEPEEPLRSENQGKKEEEEVGGVGEEDLGDDFFSSVG